MPLFISFEGPDGSGKSTQAHLLAGFLSARGHSVVQTREPGGTEFGEQIRSLLLSPLSPASDPLTMALLLSAARAELVRQVIRPALDRGDIVTTDRFADSTIAYQSFGMGLKIETAQELVHIATGGMSPNPVVYLDLPPEVGLARISNRGASNRLDVESLAFHRRVREGYLDLIRSEPERWIMVNGDAPMEDVHRHIAQAIEPYLSQVPNAV
jgi:dTMP kinase